MRDKTSIHPAIKEVIARFAALELHAARSGREVVHALGKLAADSQAQSAAELATEIDAAVEAMMAVMPAYAPPLNALHALLVRVDSLSAVEIPFSVLQAEIVAEVARYQEWSRQSRERIAAYGQRLIVSGMTLFTFTLSETVLHTLQVAARAGKRFRVLLTESRPNNDGLITATELANAGVEVTVSVDAAMSELVRQADLMIIGAESIEADGSAICKVGTYPASLVAAIHRVPIYATVDTLKFNPISRIGLEQPMEPLHHMKADFASVQPQAPLVGRLFDRTPGRLLRGLVTERGIISPLVAGAIMQEMPLSPRLNRALVRSFVNRTLKENSNYARPS